MRTKEVQQELASQSAEKKVLVIDDDPIVRDLMKNHLENDGFEVLLAEGGKKEFIWPVQNNPLLSL